jgi:hypothetical protein
VLRQDPDVVLVGEIRDQETAQLAVEASFTGHLVLATLHTNNAPSAIARLVDLGADPFLIASSVLLVLAQRLARRVCDGCAVEDEPDPHVLERLGPPAGGPEANPQPRYRRGTGCRLCEGEGTRGRVAITELLAVSPALRELVMERATERRLADQARHDGLISLREDAAARVWWGRGHGQGGPQGHARPHLRTPSLPSTSPHFPPSMEPHVPTTEQIMEVLASVEDPEINKPITELGMVEDIAIEGTGSVSRSSSRSPGVRSRTASPTTSPPQ